VELALVIAILGILAGIAAPRFFALRSFEEPFFAQDMLSSLRYAQKLAVASGCDVQVSFAPAGSYALSQRAGCRVGVFSQPVPHPGSGAAVYAGTAPAGTALASTVDPLIFDALGRARDGGLAVTDATVTVGATAISVVGETGFSFDPAS
jgi:MSHA pilin protein MshC